MYRGTTPTLEFVLPFEIMKVWVSQILNGVIAHDKSGAKIICTQEIHLQRRNRNTDKRLNERRCKNGNA